MSVPDKVPDDDDDDLSLSLQESDGGAETLCCEKVGGTVDGELALRSAGTPSSLVRSPPPASWPDGGPESPRSPCYEQAIGYIKTSHVAGLGVRSH
ncbi:hypothetical protein PoB_002043300 [Plakobranchus ocellatus]|uniref:Uncharacterized protein n=1 Tax=Plakobranchus ocellatus TaxID=259542 RepID=A0AAV3ZHB2_9GAST|nr:hypothetical protein PoB_002043300 [Plakobranchus ocellatus]